MDSECQHFGGVFLGFLVNLSRRGGAVCLLSIQISPSTSGAAPQQLFALPERLAGRATQRQEVRSTKRLVRFPWPRIGRAVRD